MLHKTFVLRTDSHTEAVISVIRANAASMAKAGTPMAVTVAESKAKRSGEQNRRYWALIQEIAENGWIDGKRFSAEAWHEHFKRTFIGCEEMPNGGLVGISTTSLSVGDFVTYTDKVQDYAQDVLAVEFT